MIVSPTAAGRKLIRDAPKTLQDLLDRRFGMLEPWEQSFVLAAVQRLASLMGAEDIDAAPVLHSGALETNADSNNVGNTVEIVKGKARRSG